MGLWRFLSNVKIVCANNQRCRADGKCTWVGEYGSYQKHLQTCENLPLPQLTEATLQKHVQNLPLDEATSQGVEPRVCHSPAAELDAKSLKAEEGIQVAADFSQNSKDGSLTDLIQQLVDIEVQSSVIEHAIETDSASQLSQPLCSRSLRSRLGPYLQFGHSLPMAPRSLGCKRETSSKS